MALPLESEIMREIGLGNHYTYWNGSPTSRWARHQAANKLQATIQRHHDNGEEIAAPIPGLIAVVKEIAQHGDEDDYVLTKTWQAASDAIQCHIHAFHAEGDERQKLINHIETYLRSTHLRQSRRDRRHFYPDYWR